MSNGLKGRNYEYVFGVDKANEIKDKIELIYLKKRVIIVL